MKQTPGQCSDETINGLFDLAAEITRRHAADLQADPTLAARLDADPAALLDRAEKLLTEVARDRVPLTNPETLASGRVNEIAAPVIDLQRRYSIRYEHHGSFRGVHHWTCIDERTYDGPESDIGTGESPQEALIDLLAKLAARAALFYAKQPPRTLGRVIHSSPFEPPTIIDEPYSDPDETD